MTPFFSSRPALNSSTPASSAASQAVSVVSPASPRRLRWLLIYPKSNTPLMVDSGKVSMPLNLMMVGTLAEKEFDVDFIDERIGDKIPEDFSHWDIVAITARTLNVNKAYEFADRALAQGRKVILGGVHPTMVADEAAAHCTSLVVGEVESIWDELAADVKNNAMKPRYKVGVFKSMTDMDRANFDLVMHSKNAKRYSFRVPVLATKGCPVGCNFCTTPTIYGKSFRTRDSQRVVDEIVFHQNRSGKKDIHISFMDDNISFKPSFMDELLNAMVGVGAKWNANISMNFLEKPYVAELAKEAGCELLNIGFESVTPETIQYVHKGSNRVPRYDDVVNNVHKNGIGIQGYFIFGFDTDTMKSFEGTYNFIMQNRIDFPVFTLATPFPGTPWYDEIEASGRIRHKDWDKYDTFHHIFKPSQLTTEQLLENFIKVQREVYSWKAIYHRLKGRPLDWIWGVNVAMHYFTRRLKPEMFL